MQHFILTFIGCQHQWAQDTTVDDCGQTQSADKEGHREDGAWGVPH